jgi:type IV secretory pathway TrbD component
MKNERRLSPEERGRQTVIATGILFAVVAVGMVLWLAVNGQLKYTGNIPAARSVPSMSSVATPTK